jgi:magnesium-protoporphyrin O-methyltransferase
MAGYAATLSRVEDYFDRSATEVWARLTSDAPVSRIRQTVREGRDRMRATVLARLPPDLRGARVLDAGCGAGQMTADLAARGAEVTAVDISPALIAIARARLPAGLPGRVTFASGDMLDDSLGRFDFVVAMDSMIYYRTSDIAAALDRLGARTAQAVVFTVAPRTPLLIGLYTLGKFFPRADRAPRMVPQAFDPLARATGHRIARIARVARGFYISDCLEFRP